MTSPVQSSQDLLQVSPEFKKEVSRSITAIAGFILVYILLFSLSLVLVAASVYGGLALIMNVPRLITIVIGAGLIGVGVMVFVFLIKFLFTKTKTDESDSLVISREDQPELVDFIHGIADATGTMKPGKILLSNEVNAAVFYNSSFWSMFLPVKKNLKIGIGLVNSVNISEFKAVVAHEFGHFSQRSMKLGSYVYQVNRVIYDMLYNNTGFAGTLRTWGSIDGILAIFVSLTIKIIQGIQWVLLQVYKVVNKSYLGLSRQMEFHADLVASTVAGSNNIIGALKRIDFADTCFQATINAYNEQWKKNHVMTSVYQDHSTVLSHLAKLNGVPLKNGLPFIQERPGNSAINRINVKDQWASHPTLEEREAYLSQFHLQSEIDERSAWILFTNRHDLESELTRLLYRDLPVDENKTLIDPSAFASYYRQELEFSAYPEIYKGFYDHREVTSFDTAVEDSIPQYGNLQELLDQDTLLLPKMIQSLRQDISVLTAIENKQVDARSFDFDGQKYACKEAANIRATLESELKSLQEKLNIIDRQIFLYSYGHLPFEQAEKLRIAYAQHFGNKKLAEDFLDQADQMMQFLSPIFSGHQLTHEQICDLIAQLKENHEAGFKTRLRLWKDKGAFSGDMQFNEKLQTFLNSNFQYYSGTFFDQEFILLNELVQEGWQLINRKLFLDFREILKMQQIQPVLATS